MTEAMIAERTYAVRGAETGTVRVFAPTCVAELEWGCKFTLSGFQGEEIVRTAYGVDALGALMNAIQGVYMTLKNLPRNFSLDDGELGWTGLSACIPIGFGRSVQDELEQLVEDQVTKIVENEVRLRRRS
jgi:hypothetical protein